MNRHFGDNISIFYFHFYPFLLRSTRARLLTLLIQAALARVSALVAAQHEPKPTPPKKLRGKKAITA